MNDTIRSIINAWMLYDKSGILPPKESIPEGSTLHESHRRMEQLIADIDSHMEQFQEMTKTNNASQEEIRALRDGVSICSPLNKGYRR